MANKLTIQRKKIKQHMIKSKKKADKQVKENSKVNNTKAEETAEQIEQQLQQEIKELNDKYLRLFAEFDNYKRRTAKEKIELLNTAGGNVIKSLLPVIDDFERATRSMTEDSNIQSVKEGVVLIHNKLKNTLSVQGLKEMENVIGSTFDTDLHEAITNLPAPNEELKGKVIDVVEKGFLLNDKVIRFAKVVVGA